MPVAFFELLVVTSADTESADANSNRWGGRIIRLLSIRWSCGLHISHGRSLVLQGLQQIKPRDDDLELHHVRPFVQSNLIGAKSRCRRKHPAAVADRLCDDSRRCAAHLDLRLPGV